MQWLKNLFVGPAVDPAVSLPPEQAAALEAWRKRPADDLTQPHFRTRYVVVDVEASGLNMIKDRLISIGAVAVSGGMIDPLDAFGIVLRQDEVSSHENILIHGIGGSAQQDGVEPAEALLRFLDYVGKAPLVAYHAEFDQAMIDRAMKRYLGVSPDLRWIDLAWVLPELYRERIDAQVQLDDWLAQFGIDNFLRHNAVADAYATAQLLQVALTRGAALGKESAQVFMDTEKARRWVRRAG